MGPVEFLIKYWEWFLLAFLIVNTIVQKMKWKGAADILTMIKGIIVGLFTIKPGKLPMIFLAFLLSCFLVVGIGLTADIVTFQWDSDMEADLAGYRIYQSTTSGVYTYGPTSPNLIKTIPTGSEVGGVGEVTIEIADGTYFWVATAFDIGGNESGPSNEITDTIDGPPGCPKIFRFKS